MRGATTGAEFVLRAYGVTSSNVADSATACGQKILRAAHRIEQGRKLCRSGDGRLRDAQVEMYGVSGSTR